MKPFFCLNVFNQENWIIYHMSFEENGSSYIETIYSIRIADTLK